MFCGSVTGAGALAPDRAAGGGAAFRGVNSSAATSPTGNSAIRPLASRTRTILVSALMNDPSIVWPERSFTRSAESVAVAPRMMARIERTNRGVRMAVTSSRVTG